MTSFRRYAMGSAAVSLVFIIMIAFKWSQVQRIERRNSIEIRDQETLDQVLAARDTIEFNSGTKAYEIPTGFFIQSISFVSASDVNITGYLWQKYPEDFPSQFTKGFIFAEEVNSDATTLRQISTHKGEQNGIRYQMICWYFDVTVRQSFDYSKYPLDILTVWLHLWSKDLCMSEQLMLIPDIEAYNDTSANIFGVAPDIVQGEWVISETFYSYTNILYNTDFGFFSNMKTQTYKEFFINVVIRRQFINAFVVNLVPLFVVALLLYAQIMTVSREKEQAERFGFNASSAIATCSALFSSFFWPTSRFARCLPDQNWSTSNISI